MAAIKQPKRILVLFSGTKSVSKQLRRLYPKSKIVTLDIDSNTNPTICVDILKWQYKDKPSLYYDMIWASPECTKFSRANHGKASDVEIRHAIKMFMKTIEIIRYYQPREWFIENPVSGLQQYPFIQKLERFRKECTYCKYGTCYKKPTNFWTTANVELQKCTVDTPCLSKALHGCHLCTAQQGGFYRMINAKQIYIRGTKKQVAYMIPAKLVTALCKGSTFKPQPARSN